MLVKLTPGVNFINVLQTAFMSADLKSAKKTDNLTVFFALSGSAHKEAAHKMLMKLTPDDHKITHYKLIQKFLTDKKSLSIILFHLMHINSNQNLTEEQVFKKC